MSRFRGLRCSWAAKVVLTEAAKSVRFQANSLQRTFGEQAQLVREKGVWSPSNPHGAAVPSHTAPHIRTGHQNHAWDIEPDGGHTRLAHWCRVRGCPISFNVPGEPWHMDPVNEAALIRLARKLSKPDPFRHLSTAEHRWVMEYRKLKIANRDRSRRVVLRRYMKAQRQLIWRLANGKIKGQKKGWNIRNRRERYRILLRYTS